MKAAQIIGSDNVIYTYLPISYDTSEHPMQRYMVVIAPDTVIKAPEDTIPEVEVQEGAIVNTQEVGITTEPKGVVFLENTPSAETACIINQESILARPDPIKIEDSLKCDTCNKEFNKITTLKRHLLVHKNVKRFKCDQCFESYNIEDNYKLHMALHQQGKPTCPLCKRQFQRLASLKSHLMMHQVEETFVCKECLAEFEKEDEYNKHMDGHNFPKLNEYHNIPYICSYCNYLFDNPKDYKEHVSYHIKIKKLVFNPKRTRRRTTNSKEYTHKCTACGKAFPKNCLLERHMRIHNGERPFGCAKCGKAFAQKCTLQIHMLKHTGHKPYKCTLCPAEYFQKGNLRVHVEKTHTAPPNIDKMYKCTQCTCIFRRISSLNAHITKAHGGMKHIEEFVDLNEGVRALKQLAEEFPVPNGLKESNTDNVRDDLLNTNSNETFVKLAENGVDGILRRYIVKQRKVGDMKWFICVFCKKEFKKPSDLIRHIRIHTREKPFKCKICGQGFALKSTLLSHLHTHDGIREYQCLICFQFFTSSRTLSSHTNKNHKGEPGLSIKYNCSTCNKLFPTLAKAKRHMDVHKCDGDEDDHIKGEVINRIPMRQPMIETDKGLMTVPAPKPRIPHAEMEEYKNRPYKCHICNAVFTKPTHLKRHMLTHSGERNFKCDVCTKAFTTSYGLKEHLRLHNPDKKFVCSLCPQTFVAKGLLKRHQIKHMSVKPYICPYCKRRFKTVDLCRKHINIHRNDENLQTNGLEITPVTNAPKIIDLADTLSDNLFGLEPQVDEQHIFKTKHDAERVTPPPLPVKPPPNQAEKSKPKRTQRRLPLKKDPIDNPQEHNVVNLPSNAQIFITKEGNYTIIMPDVNMEPSEVPTIESVNQNATEFINYDEYPVNNEVYNTAIPNVKLQNNDPILMSTIGESQDANILFMDPTLSQTSEFQNEAQIFEPFNPFNSGVNMNVQSSTIQNDQGLLPSIIDSKLSQNISKPVINDTSINLNDNLIITLNGDDFAGMNFPFNPHNTLNTTADLTLNMDTKLQTEFVCPLCKISFDTKGDLDEHRCMDLDDDNNSVANAINPMDLSDNLPEEVTLVSDLNDQLQTAHIKISTDEPGATEAVVIRHLFNNVETVLEEINDKHGDKLNKSENKCNFCSKSFKKASDLIRHIRTHTGERPFTCNKCNKSFSLKSTLQSHQRTHSETRNKEFACMVCGVYFSCRATLKIHMRIHTGVKPYECNICNMKFRTSCSRKSHMATHTKDKTKSKRTNQVIPNEENIKLTEVKNTTTQHTIEDIPIDLLQQLQNAGLLPQESDGGVLDDGVMQLNYETITDDSEVIQNLMDNDFTHISVQENKEQPSKKFECSFCHRSYTTRAVLRKHQKRHKKEFHCDKCNKQFDMQHELNKHVKLHSGYRPFSCTHCANSFSEEGSLKTHMKRIHGVHQ